MNLAGETQVVNPVNDEFETQLVNPLEDTQVFDIACETQILSLCGETQQLDDLISDCIKNMDFDTQVLNDFDDEVAGDCYDDEGTETTEINVDDDLSGDEITQSFDQSEDREKGQLTSRSEHAAMKDLEVLSDKLPNRKSSSGIVLLIVCIRYNTTLFVAFNTSKIRTNYNLVHLFCAPCGFSILL